MRAPSLFSLLIFLTLAGFQAKAQDPIVTVRFSNPEYVCSTQTYTLDVEFQCNTANKQLFGMNIRFYYPDDVLEFDSFGEFTATYGPGNPNPPIITTGSPSSGMTLFGFEGAQEYVNGYIYKMSGNPITYLSTTGWTKLFNVSFHVDDPEALNSDSFCPPVIWDMNEAGNGGINPFGGLVMTLVVTFPNVTQQVDEEAIQWNWDYDGEPGYPYGYPDPTDCINTICAMAPHTILPMCGASSPGSLSVPVTVVDLSDITEFQLTFNYDPSVMTYVDNTPDTIFNADNGYLDVSDSVSTGGLNKITMSYTGNAISLSDTAQLTELHFNYLSGECDLTWLTADNQCYYADTSGMPVFDEPDSVFYINGAIVSLIAPTTKIDSTAAVIGDLVSFTIRVWNYTNIHSGTLTLNFDPDVLVFEESVPNVAIAENYQASVINPGVLQLDWIGADTSLADATVLMYITYHYMGGTSPLTWFDDGMSCHYTSCQTSSPLPDEPMEDYYITGSITNADFTWTGDNSGDWNNESNWANNEIPDQFTSVTLDPLDNPTFWPTFNGNFVLGQHCKNLIINGNAQFSVDGNFTINPGSNLEFDSSGILQVSGNWTNSGIFAPGNGVVEFTGNNDASIAEGVPPGNYIASYVLSTFSETMVPITDGSTGPTGDNTHSDVSLGFDFVFLGVSYNQVRISTNGWLCFNLSGEDATSADNAILFNTSGPTTALAPWWDDLKADAASFITYKTEGTAPSRTFTAEWKNILAYSTYATARLNFQVRLHESTNVIEFIYGNVLAGLHSTSESASIGIKDATGGPGNFIEATQNSTNIVLAHLESDNDWPTANYRFSPPVVDDMDTFHKIIVSKSSGNLQIQKDVKITGLD